MAHSPDQRESAILVDLPDLRSLVELKDWALTPLGARENWPQSLGTATDIVLDSPLAMTVLWGPDLIQIYNDAAAVITGARHPRGLGQPTRDCWPEVWEFNAPIYAKVMTGTACSFPGQVLTLERNGTLEDAWFDLTYSPLRDEYGAMAGVLVTVVETTAQTLKDRDLAAEAERLRHADAEFLRRVLASSNDCLKVLDLDGKLRFMNEGGQRLMEVADFDAIKGCTWVDVWEGQAKIDAEAAIAVARGGANGRFQGAANTMAGKPKWWDVQITPMLGSDGQPEKLLWVSRDISDQKVAELALRGENAQLERDAAKRTVERDRVWGNSRDILVVADTHGTFQAVNPAWTRILGYTAAETVGQNFLSFVWPDDNETTQCAVNATVGGETLEGFENRYRHKDGTMRWLSWQAHMEDGDIYGYARDVTADKAHAAELLQVESHLRQAQKLEAVGQLTGGIAHDFNNMLQGVLGGLEIVQLRLEAGRYDDIHLFIDGARQSAERAAALTKRLLAFSRSQSLCVEAIDARVLTLNLQGLLRQTLKENVDLQLIFQPDLWPLQADDSQLENALLNLAINARDAMPEGGRLTISATNITVLENDAGRSRELAPGDYVSITVTDTGEGMPQNVIDRAFDPFFTTKLIGEGTGLGLSMIFGFAKQSHGNVSIESEVGKGTKFTLCLPRAFGPIPTKTARATPSTPAARSGEHILVVDDEEVVRLVMTDALSDLGYQFEQALDGDAALHILRSERRIDLMISDVGLPGINGRQLSEMARQLRPDLKILFVTGYAAAAGIEGGLDDRTDLLCKPFTIATFSAKVRFMLDETAPCLQPA